MGLRDAVGIIDPGDEVVGARHLDHGFRHDAVCPADEMGHDVTFGVPGMSTR